MHQHADRTIRRARNLSRIIGAGVGFVSGVLYGVQPTDPATFTIVALAMIGVAVLACLVPGRRATNVDPAIALRHD